MRTAVCLVAAVACGAVGAQGHVVGVFDCQAVGGSGTSTDGFMGVFDGLEGYDAQVLTDLDMSALYGCDVVILYDTHEPGNVVANWVGNLTQFVQAGGSVLQIYHHHQFGSVGTGVLKVRVPEVRPVGDGPLVEGISQWTTDWPDHIILAKGPQATTFIESTESKPVAARGVIGKGKLISCGIALGVKQDWRTSKAPTGMELKLLENMLDWLKPEERWPARMANYAASAELVTWVGTKYVRQPAPVMVRLKGVVERASERGTVDLTVTDSAGKQSTSQAVWVAKSVEGADVGLVDETIEVATSGLAFGVAQVRRVLR
ncbi:MAG TPA: hypothetical protein QGH10_25390, partial [Armatimonadota bacterium]|nr:hypothetical protein [Armatimonadota bacterium]